MRIYWQLIFTNVKGSSLHWNEMKSDQNKSTEERILKIEKYMLINIRECLF